MDTKETNMEEKYIIVQATVKELSELYKSFKVLAEITDCGIWYEIAANMVILQDVLSTDKAKKTYNLSTETPRQQEEFTKWLSEVYAVTLVQVNVVAIPVAKYREAFRVIPKASIALPLIKYGILC